MQFLGNLKIHFLALVLTVVAEFIGIKKLGPVVLLPLLYTLVLGLLISIPKFKILTIKQMEKSADYIGIAVMILMVKVGLGIGPNLGILTSAGFIFEPSSCKPARVQLLNDVAASELLIGLRVPFALPLCGMNDVCDPSLEFYVASQSL